MMSFLGTTLMAAEMTEQDVHRAVQTWVRSVTADARPHASVIEMEPHQVDGQTVAYIAHLSGGGFCLCGADDLVLPVYYYCPRGTYNPDNSNYHQVLREIVQRLEYLRQPAAKGSPLSPSDRQLLQDRRELWTDLSAGRPPRLLRRSKSTGKTDPDSMLIDFTPRWDQDSPYNDQCPDLNLGAERTRVGAAALAMAQIMYYWQWPPHGKDDSEVDYQYRWSDTWREWPLGFDPGIPPDSMWMDRLEWTPAGGGKLRMRGYWDTSLIHAAKVINDDPSYQSAVDHTYSDFIKETDTYNVDFGAQSYDWSIMEDSRTAMPLAGSEEVAKICYHAGVAAEINYGVMNSDAALADVEYAFKDHFFYDQDVKEESKDIDAITEEIRWYRPVAFKGDDPKAGSHVWIFYGFNKGTDPDRQFLTNLGRGGLEDGWYTCDGISGFTSGQREIIRIAPENVVRFVHSLPAKPGGDGSPDQPYTDIDQALAEAPDSCTLIFKAGTDMPFAGDQLVIDRPMVLKGKMVLGE